MRKLFALTIEYRQAAGRQAGRQAGS